MNTSKSLKAILHTMAYEDIHAKWAAHDDSDQQFADICYEAAAKAEKAIVEAVEGLVNEVDRSNDFTEWNGVGVIFKDELLQAIKEWQDYGG